MRNRLLLPLLAVAAVKCATGSPDYKSYDRTPEFQIMKRTYRQCARALKDLDDPHAVSPQAVLLGNYTFEKGGCRFESTQKRGTTSASLTYEGDGSRSSFGTSDLYVSHSHSEDGGITYSYQNQRKERVYVSQKDQSGEFESTEIQVKPLNDSDRISCGVVQNGQFREKSCKDFDYYRYRALVLIRTFLQRLSGHIGKDPNKKDFPLDGPDDAASAQF